MARSVGGNPHAARSVGGSARNPRGVGGSPRSPRGVGRKNRDITGEGFAVLALGASGQGAFTAAVAGDRTGTGAATLVLTGAGTGFVTSLVTGTGAATLTISAAGAGTHIAAVTGTGAVTLAMPSEGFGYVGDLIFTGTGAATLELVAAGTGAVLQPIVGTGSATLSLTAAGQGSVFGLVTGSGAATLALTASGAGGFAGSSTGSSFTADFVSGIYTGCSASDFSVVQAAALNAENANGSVVGFAANTKRLADDGWSINAEAAPHIGRNSMNPQAWAITAPGWTGSTKTNLGTSGGFSPVRYFTQNATSGQIIPGLTGSVSAGQTVFVKVRAQAVSGYSSAGLRIFLNASEYVNSNDISVTNPTFASGASPNSVIHSIVRNGNGTLDVLIRHVVQSGGLSVGIAPHTDSAAQIDIWGCQVRVSSFDGPWQAVGTSTVTPAVDVATIGGTPGSLFAASAGTVVVDIGPPDSFSGNVVSSSAGQILGLTGYTSFSSGSVAGAVGMGGFQGISRLGIAWDGSGISICCNSGAVKTGSALSVSGAIRLLSGVSGKVRKITGSPVKLSSAQLQNATSIIGQNFVNAGNALNLSVATETFFDDFLSSATLRRRGGDLTAEPVAPDVLPMLALYDTVGEWIPRYVFNTRSAEGGGPEPINQEWQEYMDDQRPGNYNPFSFSNSILTITAEHFSNLPSSQQALVDVDPNHGGQYQYVSGTLVTARKFKQKFGYFEARLKYDTDRALWPAFWALPAEMNGSEVYSSIAELDIVEYVGVGNPINRGYDTGALHWNNYANNVGIGKYWPFDFADDFHTFGALWVAGVVHFYRDGLHWGSITSGGNFDSNPMYLLLNLAIGGTWPGNPTSETQAAMPAAMHVDYVRVHRLS